jgi:hypothetical protein
MDRAVLEIVLQRLDRIETKLDEALTGGAILRTRLDTCQAARDKREASKSAYALAIVGAVVAAWAPAVLAFFKR